MANVALIFSGQYVKFVSNMPAAPGVDPWVNSLNWLMSAVVAGGAMILGLMKFMQTQVLTDPECVNQNNEAKRKKTKTKMTMKESAAFLSNSPYIRDLALLVIGYGIISRFHINNIIISYLIYNRYEYQYYRSYLEEQIESRIS